MGSRGFFPLETVIYARLNVGHAIDRPREGVAYADGRGGLRREQRRRDTEVAGPGPHEGELGP